MAERDLRTDRRPRSGGNLGSLGRAMGDGRGGLDARRHASTGGLAPGRWLSAAFPHALPMVARHAALLPGAFPMAWLHAGLDGAGVAWVGREGGGA
ncbi:hypothetical protein HMPREF9946_04598 [Acetobacteraceae bacterium AT-5844]|nr:hypothetical protein HMPREF9946_04598 [Acetobacteraceae bacterium AT-5844]